MDSKRRAKQQDGIYHISSEADFENASQQLFGWVVRDLFPQSDDVALGLICPPCWSDMYGKRRMRRPAVYEASCPRCTRPFRLQRDGSMSLRLLTHPS